MVLNTPDPHSPVEQEGAAAPSGVFAPRFSTHPVAVLTLGRQKENDADKSNYFE
ncbi:hypothetical protein [Streptomyces sp. I05A-00742]|uniref:hypothetical protein n=1 Tax=Streptomyces sp. I05A-00742 TaxID=2732853 RepID=UPI0014878D41|nr:hypothetical protein [Streptomyces sp. I05A-00742]